MNGKLRNLVAMLIFGSIGVFIKEINLSSSEIAFTRGVIGSLCLFLVCLFIKQKLSWKGIRENIWLLCFSGAAIGINWMLLFEAYKYTTISNATLSYYVAPIFVILSAPFVLKERITPVKGCCVFAAMVGLILILYDGGVSSKGTYNHTLGILYGLLAAMFYASAILMNKFIHELSGVETTLVQLIGATIVLMPYVFIKEHMTLGEIELSSVFLILIVGVVHTGLAYFLYFTSLQELNGQTIAILSYIDPISAVIIAAIVLGERMSLVQMFGGILILGATYLSERLTGRKKAIDG